MALSSVALGRSAAAAKLVSMGESEADRIARMKQERCAAMDFILQYAFILSNHENLLRMDLFC